MVAFELGLEYGVQGRTRLTSAYYCVIDGVGDIVLGALFILIKALLPELQSSSGTIFHSPSVSRMSTLETEEFV